MKPFDMIVASACLLQVYNLYALGQGHINYGVMVLIYGLFAVSEAWVAVVDNRKSYWLFVALSTFGAIQGTIGYVKQ
jgi:hypothetical protein